MKVRAITALFFVIVVLASMLLGVYPFTGFFVLLSIYCLDEFYRMVSSKALQPSRFWGVILGLSLFGIYAAVTVGDVSTRYLLLCVPLVIAVFIAALYRKQDHPFLRIAYTLLGVVYVVLPFMAFFELGFVTDGFDYRIPLGFMLILWGNDTGAYLVGKFFGKHRLFERISPKKTWEGLFGGVLLALVTAMVLAHYFPILASWQWIGMAVIVSVFGTFGDLVESMLKRSLQVKDSGSVLPGHGGLLDRFDGLLLAAPLVLVFLELVLSWNA